MADFVETVTTFVERHALLDGVTRVVVGVSGGVDSMVVLDCLCRWAEADEGRRVHVVHVNFGLRDGADDDATFVREWVADRPQVADVRVVEVDAEAYADREGASLQEAARRLRYRAFARRAEAVGAEAVAVGHHRDDQAETLLLNLLRGSGPDGLAGMAPSRPLRDAPDVSLIRPLLVVRRADVEAFAEAKGIPWRTDPSNASLAYKRNVLRHEVLPLLETHFDGATETIARTADLMGDYVQATFAPALAEKLDAAFRERDDGGWLDLAVLREEPRVWQQRLVLEALRRVLPSAPQSRAVAEEVADLIDAQVGRFVELGGGRVWRDREGLKVVPPSARPDPGEPQALKRGATVDRPSGRLSLTVTTDRPDDLAAGAPLCVWADADSLPDALVVRPWRAGDRLQPLGMNGTKPVSDLLTDARVPPHRRPHVDVVAGRGDGPVVWVVGHRLDHRVRVRPATTRFARFSFRPRENPVGAYQS